MKKLLCVLILLAMTAALLTAAAEQPEIEVMPAVEIVTETEAPGTDLATDYARHVFGYARRGSQVLPTDPVKLKIYRAIQAAVEDIAAGRRSSTSIALGLELFEIEDGIVRPRNLGLERFVNQDGTPMTAQEVAQLFVNTMWTEYIDPTSDLLRMNCAWEFYWFGRRVGLSPNFAYYTWTAGQESDELRLAMDDDVLFYITLSAVAPYALDSSTVDIAMTGVVTAAKQNADSIVAQAVGMGDTEKMVYYGQQIRELSDYNDAAAAEGY